mmetsp:Transcript_13388/g.37702  ORF Transcript_13388/g.37702 Transcript_13388/m.37702 type:complete len:703 (-) Transcript_13388:226-2334(-)
MVKDCAVHGNEVIGGCGVPSVALRWIVSNTFTNVELAVLSNVSRGWREIVAQCIVDVASQEGDEAEPSAPQTFTRLLLPSIIREFHSSREDIRTMSSKSEEEKNEVEQRQQDETYCVAWFHPDGMKFEQLSIVKPSPDSFGGQPPEDGAPPSSETLVTTKTSIGEGTDPSANNHKFLFTKNNSRLDQTSAALTRPESCPASENIVDWGTSVLYQWNGYSEAIDVLSPFGYSRSFLRRILEKTQGKFIGSSTSQQSSGSDNKSDAIGTDKAVRLPPSSPWVYPTRCNSSFSSYAVRGAVYARPEGYCHCWDTDSFDTSHSKDETWMRKRKQRKRVIQRQLLPKILWSKHDNVDTKEAGGILRPCIQFLNVDSANAVRLFTPKFKKPVSTPMTVFCVAIATEDGCFFSGLEQQFEMGHMHPTKDTTEINNERSPICLNAEYTGRKVRTIKSEEKESDYAREGCLDPSCGCYFPPTNDDEYKEDDFADFLQSTNEEFNDGSMNDDDDDECAHIVRGRFGPGMWHCYAAIFDGERSVIRIDGVEESIDVAPEIPPSFQACLDGITIGSDHAYDMTLCFGEGSDGEGEGAISELVFFKGRLQAEDIESLESHLMAKHGISIPFKSRNERVNDDYYSRLAHSLMNEAPSTGVNRKRKQGEDVKARSVPLRYMTKLRQVAWEQNDKVTGRPRSIRRIGASLRKGSVSEW